MQELARKEFFQHVVFHNPEYLDHNVWEDKTDIQRADIVPQILDTSKTETDRVNTVVSKLKA